MNNKKFLVLFLGALSAFGPFVTDLYLPALPYMANFFNTTTSAIQLTLTSSLIGLAGGQLLIGPISDKYGRKKPLLISLIIFTLSTIMIIFSPNLLTMIILRFIQGLASAGSLVIARAVIADLYEGDEMAHFFGLLMAVNGMAPIFSPILGSLILVYAHWTMIFITLALLGVILIFATIKFKETLLVTKRSNFSISQTYLTMGHVMTNRSFMLFVFIQACALATLFSYISSSPFILQTHYGLSAITYSLCFALNGIAITIGSRWSSKFAGLQALKFGIYSLFIVAIILSIILIFDSPLWLVETGFFSLMFTLGWILPSSSALAMNLERPRAGSASALLGFFPAFFGGIVSPLVGMGQIFYSTSLTIIICASVALILYNRVIKS